MFCCYDARAAIARGQGLDDIKREKRHQEFCLVVFLYSVINILKMIAKTPIVN